MSAGDKDMIFSTENEKDIIENILFECRNDLYNKNISDEKLRELSEKFASKAEFMVIRDENSGMDNMGYASVYANDITDRIAWLSIIVVRKKYRGGGYGNYLLKSTIKTAGKNGMQKIRLEVAKTNLIAYEMYKKFGFEKIGDNDSNILMELKIRDGCL